jgi:hypothetical protein
VTTVKEFEVVECGGGRHSSSLEALYLVVRTPNVKKWSRFRYPSNCWPTPDLDRSLKKRSRCLHLALNQWLQKVLVQHVEPGTPLLPPNCVTTRIIVRDASEPRSPVLSICGQHPACGTGSACYFLCLNAPMPKPDTFGIMFGAILDRRTVVGRLTGRLVLWREGA